MMTNPNPSISLKLLGFSSKLVAGPDLNRLLKTRRGASKERYIPRSSSWWRRGRRICAVPFCEGVPLTLKALKLKDYVEAPQSLGDHLKKRRRELDLLQREVAAVPVSASGGVSGLRPEPEPQTLAERVGAKRRVLGVTVDQVAQCLGWDEGSLRRYLKGTWRLSRERTNALELMAAWLSTTCYSDVR